MHPGATAPLLQDMMNAVSHSRQSKLFMIMYVFKLAKRLNFSIFLVAHWYNRKMIDLTE